MNDTVARRAALLTGLALAATVALWWLANARIALDRGADNGGAAAQALPALWLLRAITVALVTVRVGALQGVRAGTTTGLLLVAPAWPLVTLLWAAGPASIAALCAAEVSLLVAAALLPGLGHVLHRLLPAPAAADLAAAGVGTALAALCWFGRGAVAAALS